MAKQEARWRKKAHESFDPIWVEAYNKLGGDRDSHRRKAYEWLSRQLGISRAICHMSMFDIETCQKVIEVSELRKEMERKMNGL